MINGQFLLKLGYTAAQCAPEENIHMVKADQIFAHHFLGR